MLVILGAAADMNDDLFVLFIWLPGMWSYVVAESSIEDVGLIFQCVCLAFVWSMLAVLSMQEFRTTRKLEKYVAQLKRAQEHEDEKS